MDLGAVIDEYFTQPLARPDSVAPYNLVNTSVFAAVALAASYLIYRLLRWRKVAIDGAFVKAVLPFVVLAASVRVIVDAGVLPREVVLGGMTFYPFVTPGLYVATFAVFALSLMAAWWTSGRQVGSRAFTRHAFWAGVALAAVPALLAVAWIKNPAQLAAIAALSLTGPVLLWAYDRATGGKTTATERWTSWAQSLDGAATFVGLGFGVPGVSYIEQHVVGNFIIDAGGAWAFFALKVLFGLGVVLAARWEFSRPADADARHYSLALVTVLGMGPGLRNALRIAAGV